MPKANYLLRRMTTLDPAPQNRRGNRRDTHRQVTPSWALTPRAQLTRGEGQPAVCPVLHILLFLSSSGLG